MPDKLTPAQIQQAQKNAADDGFLHRVAVAADQDLNVDSGGLPDETISSRVRRISDAHPRCSWNPGVWLAKTINAGLNLLQNNHGQRAQSGDLERALKVAATERRSLGISSGPVESLTAEEYPLGVRGPEPEPAAANRRAPDTTARGATPESCDPERREGSLSGAEPDSGS